MTGILTAIAVLFGLLLGSFANVLIHRVPLGLSIVSPPSACPRCGTRIKARHNVPVVGWLWLRGRCAACGAPISGRYPLVELGTGVAFGLVTWFSGPGATTFALLALVYFGIVLSAIDLETRRLPNPLTAAFAITASLAILVPAAFTGDWSPALRAVTGAVALGLLYGIAFVVYPKGMGFGDVKLAPTIGAVLAFLGWPQLVVGAFAAFVWGAAVGLVVMARSGRGRGVAIPFGPWMCVGAVTGVLVGPAIAEWYLGTILGI
ncbi:prepilin peptidase [Demequina phytophila]|uniref:prepilin peptidase n=1 Tax=Demequina phytophila TaxID=1638981 RepID=UPI000AC48359|nr:A24 family peptidase [Demequina phytophila]